MPPCHPKLFKVGSTPCYIYYLRVMLHFSKWAVLLVIYTTNAPCHPKRHIKVGCTPCYIYY